MFQGDNIMQLEEARTSKFAVEKAKWLVSLQPQTVLVSELGPGMCHTHKNNQEKFLKEKK